VSARATHLKAVLEKVSLTTIERKKMSTKTTFKRIALVAVASLGLGLLSAVPSQALIENAGITISATNGTATNGSADSDTSTGGLISLRFQNTNAAPTDSVTLTSVNVTKPSGATAPTLKFLVTDTTSSSGVYTIVSETPSGTAITKTTGASTDSMTTVIFKGSAAGTFNGSIRVFLDTNTVGSQLSVGTYTYTVRASAFDSVTTNAISTNTKSVDVSIVVSAPSTTASATYSTATLSSGSSFVNVAGGADSVVVGLATASYTTPRAVLRVTLKNSSGVGTYTNESVTVTTTLGLVGTTSASTGKAVTFNYTAGQPLDIGIFADGTAGTGTLTISSTSVSFASKSFSLYSATVSKITATKRANVLSLGSNSAVITAVAADANGVTNGSATAVYAYSSNTAVISDSGTACTYNSTYGRHECALTAVAAGTATVTLKNSATGTATVSSDAISLTVNSNSPVALKMAFDKSSYAPGEKGRLFIWAVDAAGNPVGSQTISNLINAAGISRTGSFSGTEPTWTATSYTLAQKDAVSDGYEKLDPVAALTVYMPYTGGTVSVTAVGGSSLPLSGQVAVTASATVTDSASQALSAVTALASQVAAFITKVNAQITTLTDLVMKIQKKVKA